MIPNRKRRYRNSQELYAADPSIPCSTTNVNGQIRKKPDLSCVGKLFHFIFFTKSFIAFRVICYDRTNAHPFLLKAIQSIIV